MSISSSMTNIEIKNVIVPFDFSNPAKNALQHAGSIAKRFNAGLILVGLMDSSSSKALQFSGGKLADFETLAKPKLMECAQGITGCNIEYVVNDGRWSRAVGDICKQKEGCIIVLGVGDKGRDGFFDGPHAYRIVDSVNIPLLVVKDNQSNHDYKIIATPLDQTSDTRQKLPFVKLMGGAFDAKVCLLGVQTNITKDSTTHMESIMRQAAQYITMKVRTYEDKMVTSKNEIGDVLSYAEQEKADMLIIMSSHEKAISQMFAAPYAQQVTDKATIPVLICPLTVSKVVKSVSV